MGPSVKAVEAIGMAKIVQADDTLLATASTRVNLALLHLLSAADCSRRVREIEEAHAGESFGPFWENIFAQATASVLISVAGLEAYANELFIDHDKVFPELKVEVMAKLWELYERKPVLEKFDFALVVRRGSRLDRGGPVFQAADALIKLRNGLVHFKPEWFDQQKQHARLSKLLQGKIENSPFLQSEPLFPRAWAGSQCTDWAVRSVADFIIDFEQRASLVRLANKLGKIDSSAAARLAE
jgi:hypothetical protein